MGFDDAVASLAGGNIQEQLLKAKEQEVCIDVINTYTH